MYLKSKDQKEKKKRSEGINRIESLVGGVYNLQAKHLILVWIMKVKEPKNQVDFIEVLYNVAVNAWGATF